MKSDLRGQRSESSRRPESDSAEQVPGNSDLLSFERSATEILTGERMFCRNALLWGLGNGLVSTSLVIYIILDLTGDRLAASQTGLAISWIIAAPRIIGLLRLFAPELLDLVGSRRRVCFAGYFLSPLVLVLLPYSVPLLAGESLSTAFCIIGLIWGLYHLIEYFATVSLWSWIGDFFSSDRRPVFLALRERNLIFGQIVGMLSAGLYTRWMLSSAIFSDERWRVYLLPSVVGIVFLLSSSLPLLHIAEIPWRKSESFRRRLVDLFAPIRSRSFLPFLLFGAWIQIANGLAQSPQSVFQGRILGITMLTLLLLQSGTRFGQSLFSASVGRLLLRYGNYPVIAVSLVAVSLGPLFYLAASPDCWYPIIGAAILWIAWIGVNLGINNLLISLAPVDGRTSYIALYFTVSTFAFGMSALAGGQLLDQYKNSRFEILFLSQTIDYYQLVFFLGWFFRSCGLFFLFWGGKILYSDRRANSPIAGNLTESFGNSVVGSDSGQAGYSSKEIESETDLTSETAQDRIKKE